MLIYFRFRHMQSSSCETSLRCFTVNADVLLQFDNFGLKIEKINFSRPHSFTHQKLLRLPRPPTRKVYTVIVYMYVCMYDLVEFPSLLTILQSFFGALAAQSSGQAPFNLGSDSLYSCEKSQSRSAMQKSWVFSAGTPVPSHLKCDRIGRKAAARGAFNMPSTIHYYYY